MSKTSLPPRIHVIDYNQDALTETDVTDIETLAQYRTTKSVSWIDIQGLGDSSLLNRIQEIFDIPLLALEDIVHIPQRPKVEDFEQAMLIITSMVTLKTMPDIAAEQISIFFGPQFIITFQEQYGDILEPVRNRLRQARGAIRKSGSDYLAYAIVDAIIDAYYPLLESLGEHLQTIEDEVIENPSQETLQSVYKIKRELSTLRRILWPQREALTTLIREESKLVKKAVREHIRDCYDHCVQAIDVLESYRELCAGLTDLYMSGLSNKMNEVMKVLTIIATIFIPLSFLAGIYGMNFEHMPELTMRWSYPAFWCVIVTLGVGMLLYFRHCGWLGAVSGKKVSDSDDDKGNAEEAL